VISPPGKMNDQGSLLCQWCFLRRDITSHYCKALSGLSAIDLPISCPWCGSKFMSPEGLYNHCRRHSLGCPICGVVLNNQEMEWHIPCHTSLYICEFCGDKFNLTASLKNHKLNSLKCKSKRFPLSGQLQIEHISDSKENTGADN
jgi:DNA-directed RNA polymerase subunit RPC12/RpoP